MLDYYHMDLYNNVTYIHIYRMSPNSRITFRRQVEHVKMNRKVLYHFATFAIINEK